MFGCALDKNLSKVTNDYSVSRNKLFIIRILIESISCEKTTNSRFCKENQLKLREDNMDSISILYLRTLLELTLNLLYVIRFGVHNHFHSSTVLKPITILFIDRRTRKLGII